MPAPRLVAVALFVLSLAVVGCGRKPRADDDDPPADGPNPRPRVAANGGDPGGAPKFGAPPRFQPPEDPDAPFPQPGTNPAGKTPFPQAKGKAAPPPKWDEDEKPFPMPGAGGKKGAKAGVPEWEGDGTTITIKGNKSLVFGPPGCPVALVGEDVIDLKTFQSIRTINAKFDQNADPVLSNDGKYVACTEKGRNQQDTPTHVYATETGEKVLTVMPPAKGAFADVVAFYGSTHVLVGGRHGPVIEVWDIAKAKKVGGLTCPDRQVRAGQVAFTQDGSYFAAIAHDRLVVVGTKSGKQAAMATPPGGGPLGAIGVFAWAKGLAFSHDGSELALFTTQPAPRLLVWNTKGQITMDAAVPMPKWVGRDGALQWLPDGSGWMVNGSIFDRATKRVLVATKPYWASHTPPHMLDQDRVIGAFAGNSTTFKAVTIPWDRVKAAAKAMGTKADAYMAPGRPVALDLQLVGLRGDENETKQILTKALVDRLARDGVPVTAQAFTVLRLRLTEKAGEVLPIRERQTPFDFRGRDTGRTATEAQGAAVLELWTQGEPAPVWRDTLSAGSSRSFSEEINDATVRKSMLEHLGRQLDTLNLPYFMPKARDTIALPAVID